ncbi:MAG: hypothetical protein PVH29_02510 [Candidatus Zixiibacteriota bacterium]|jgi:hypothetical protein
MRCPGCGGPLAPDELQIGVYQCAQCGEVEIDEGGAYVRGRFFECGDEEDDGRGIGDEWDASVDDYAPTWEDVFAAEDAISPFEE